MKVRKLATFNVNGISRGCRIAGMARARVAGHRLPAGAEGGRSGFPVKLSGRRLWGDLEGASPCGTAWPSSARANDPIDSARAARGPGGRAEPLSRGRVQGIVIGCLYLPNGNPAARAEVRVQAGLVRAPARARPGASRQRTPGGSGRRLQRRADRLRHLQPALLAEKRAPAAGKPRALPAPARRRAGWMLCAASSRTRRSSRSGITSGSTGTATPGCASITCCSTRNGAATGRGGVDRWVRGLRGRAITRRRGRRCHERVRETGATRWSMSPTRARRAVPARCT